MVCCWKGFAVWDAGSGTIDCHYEAEIVLKPEKAAAEDKKLQQMLGRNSFLTKEEIAEFFKKSLCRFLDDEFEEYCTAEDYYPPVVEDFEIDYRVRDWCKKTGFKMLSCEGTGDDNGFEPKYRRRW